QAAQVVAAGRFGIALVSGKHGFESVGGNQNQFGKSCAVGFGHFLGENVFQFVRKFAEAVETAGGGIALEGVDHAANAADDFFIRGTSFEFETSLVERLEELVGGLKKKS